MNYPDLIKWIFEFVYEHWILTFLFILVLRRFSIFTINLSDKKAIQMLLTIESKFNIGDNVHVPKENVKS